MTRIGFKGSKSDPCLFLRHRKGFTDYVAFWVDDLVYCRRVGKFYEEFEVVHRKKFLVSEVGDLNWFLGMQIRKDANKIEISQGSYIEKLLGNFGMSDAKTAFTPALEKSCISSVEVLNVLQRAVKKKKMMCCYYRGSIGSLNYLANTSRPDIPFVVKAALESS